jgi:hypothetical protein
MRRMWEAQSGGEGIPGENVERFPDVGVAMPAEHEKEVAQGGQGEG